MSLDFPLSVRSRIFLFLFLSWKRERGCVFAVFFALIPGEEILDFIAHGSIIRVFAVKDKIPSPPVFTLILQRGRSSLPRDV